MVLDTLKKRRSVRHFEDRPIELEKIDHLLEAVLRSPSSRSLNPWEFILVQDKEMLGTLSNAKPHGISFLKNAPLAIVVCANPEKCDVWIEDCAIASLILHLAATDLDLGSCWVQIRLREHVDGGMAEDFIKEKLDMPENMVVEAIIAIGYPKTVQSGHPKESLPKARIHLEKFGDK